MGFIYVGVIPSQVWNSLLPTQGQRSNITDVNVRFRELNRCN